MVLFKWVSGFALGTHIFLRNEWKDFPKTSRKHELIHVAQYLDKGILPFFYSYFIKQMNVNYYYKWQEQEAYSG